MARTPGRRLVTATPVRTSRPPFLPPARPGPGAGTSVVLLLGLFVFALMGRFTLDRLGFADEADLDLRLVGAPVVAAAVLLWRYRPGVPGRSGGWPRPATASLVLFTALALTAFWAPYGARVGDRLTDLLGLVLLVVCVTVVAVDDPVRARRTILVALLLAGVVYAGAGLLSGDTNVQGRTVAFGGGPNVFIRVVGLGLVATVTLAVSTRRRVLLLPVPLLVTAAVLSGSRGGLAAIAVAGAAAVVLSRRHLSVRGVLTVLAAVPLLGAALLAVADPATVEVLRRRFVEDLFVTDQFSGRPELFAQTLDLFLTHPLVGGGLDAYFVAFGRSEDLSYPHNLVLEVAATGGVIALGLLAGVAVSVVRAWRRIGALSADQVGLLCAAVLVAAASMTSGDLYDTRFLWIFALLAVLPDRDAR
ncbi:O-antigen ligase [Pseudonocardia sp. McavD-2-B]|uniref:O-antigen ligase family protein n=1 Tax=Pseudonocardia sp. McavD-2-B TaxID=2954499 RepID=UPI0020969509|nr:O-antigen ligase family protein [Pseudonocardia sp. McavD-2-B]MCO7193204.1 O-antigen ligase family protein [Pseudonocardia sp. McavD-2-B]